MTNNSKKQEPSNIYIVGKKDLNNELLLYFLQQSTESSFNCSLHTSFSMLPINKTIGTKNLVLCNLYDENICNHPDACARHKATAPSDCFWVCINVPENQKISENAINNGVHGIFYETDNLDTLKRGMIAILQGELWFSRDTLSATLSNFVDKSCYQASQEAEKAGLTKREKEILKLIALGQTNDQIADKLNISNLTVKTHVSNIYPKINVPNRIQAIFWATKNYLQLKD